MRGTMTDRLWAPWRQALFDVKRKPKGCIFCLLPKQKKDRENLIVFRGERCFVILNRYPYTSGHLMVVPYEHTDDLGEMADVAVELFALASRSMEALRKVMGPEGFNLGMNIGRAAGAGIPGHGHLHVVPRWNGDHNFMPVLGDKRVINSALGETWKRLRPCFA